jgi:hypothetical protein
MLNAGVYFFVIISVVKALITTLDNPDAKEKTLSQLK